MSIKEVLALLAEMRAHKVEAYGDAKAKNNHCEALKAMAQVEALEEAAGYFIQTHKCQVNNTQ